MNYLANNYGVQQPLTSSWTGHGLDTAREFRNVHATALMQTKTDLADFVMDGYHLNGNELFKLQRNMGEERVDDPAVKAAITAAFRRFQEKNALVVSGKAILPDSVYRKYYPKK